MEIIKIEFSEIERVLNELIDESITREEASNWVTKLQIAEDDRSLIYLPEDMEQKIWEAILFLQGIGLKDSPNTYLHNINDIKKFLFNFMK